MPFPLSSFIVTISHCPQSSPQSSRHRGHWSDEGPIQPVTSTHASHRKGNTRVITPPGRLGSRSGRGAVIPDKVPERPRNGMTGVNPVGPYRFGQASRLRPDTVAPGGSLWLAGPHREGVQCPHFERLSRFPPDYPPVNVAEKPSKGSAPSMLHLRAIAYELRGRIGLKTKGPVGFTMVIPILHPQGPRRDLTMIDGVGGESGPSFGLRRAGAVTARSCG